MANQNQQRQQPQSQQQQSQQQSQEIPYGTQAGQPRDSQIRDNFGGEQPTKLDGTPDQRFDTSSTHGRGEVKNPEHDMRLAENKTPDKIQDESQRRTESQQGQSRQA